MKLNPPVPSFTFFIGLVHPTQRYSTFQSLSPLFSTLHHHPSPFSTVFHPPLYILFHTLIPLNPPPTFSTLFTPFSHPFHTQLPLHPPPLYLSGSACRTVGMRTPDMALYKMESQTPTRFTMVVDDRIGMICGGMPCQKCNRKF